MGPSEARSRRSRQDKRPLPGPRTHWRHRGDPGQTPAAQLTRHKGSGIPLAILGAPKPGQFRFYVGDKAGRATSRGEATREHAGFEPSRRLRGRKLYPHHRVAVPRTGITGYWQAGADQTFKREGTDRKHWHPEWRRSADVRDSQNRSMRSWIAPGARFRMRIYVDNLHPAELGALLRICNTDDGAFFRMGGGRPLGFGSASLRITGASLQLGVDLPQQLASAFATTPSVAASDAWRQTVQERIADFDAATKSLYGDTPDHLLAYDAATRGFETGLPVHYPRIGPDPDPDGENFRWFQANDQEEHHYTLPSLPNDKGLPYLHPNGANTVGLHVAVSGAVADGMVTAVGKDVATDVGPRGLCG